MAVEIPAGALSAEQLQTLEGMGAQVVTPNPVDALVASMPGASPAQLLQAAAGNTSVALGIAQRFVPNAGSLTFENPFRHPLREALQVGAFTVLGGTGFNAFGIAPPGAAPTTRLSWQDPQVNFPRGIDRIYVPGTEPPPSTRLPVPYEPPPVNNPGPFAFGIGGIGAILTGVIGAMWEGWPNALDPELGPYDTTAGGRNPIPGQGIPHPPPQGPDPSVFGPPSYDQGPPSPAGVGDNPPFPTFPAPYPETLPPPAGDVIFGPTPEVGPPVPATTPAPAPAPKRGLPPWVWPAIGTLGAIQLGRAGRSRSSQTLPSVPVTVGLDLGTLEDALANSLTSSTSSTSSTTYLTQAGGSGVYDYDDGCNCSSKKRGKKRKCLAWGQLSWRSGPKKGRPAGRRCIRFAPD